MQGWRGLEASRVKRYRLGKDRKIGSFGQWIPIYQHPPSPLLILYHFLLILVLLPVSLDISGQLVLQAIGELQQGVGPWPPLYLLLRAQTQQKCVSTYTFSRGIRTRNASVGERMRFLLRVHEVWQRHSDGGKCHIICRAELKRTEIWRLWYISTHSGIVRRH